MSFRSQMSTLEDLSRRNVTLCHVKMCHIGHHTSVFLFVADGQRQTLSACAETYGIIEDHIH